LNLFECPEYESISIGLIHFDTNIIDLKSGLSREFDPISNPSKYPQSLKYGETIHKEENFFVQNLREVKFRVEKKSGKTFVIFVESKGAEFDLEDYTNFSCIKIQIVKQLAKINELNKLLEKNNFSYTIKKVERESNDEFHIDFILEHIQTEDLVELKKLTTGEQIILLFIIWEFRCKNDDKTVLLLDEPDSHLHPAEIKALIERLKKMQNVQVMMTTHNPVSLEFVEIKNIVQLTKVGEKKILVKSIQNKSDIIKDISDDLFYIKEKFKRIFVEGLDAPFYDLIAKNCIKCDTRLPYKFQGVGNKEFRQIFLKSNNDEDTPDYNLNEFLFGINDGDAEITEAKEYYEIFKDLFVFNSDKTTDIKEFNDNYARLARYNIENYIFDPVNLIFAIKDKVLESEYFKQPNVKKYLEEIKEFKTIIEFLNSGGDKQTRESRVEQLNQVMKETNDFLIEKVYLKTMLIYFSKYYNYSFFF